MCVGVIGRPSQSFCNKQGVVKADVMFAPARQAGASRTAALGSARMCRWAPSRSATTCLPSGRPRHDQICFLIPQLVLGLCTAGGATWSRGVTAVVHQKPSQNVTRQAIISRFVQRCPTGMQNGLGHCAMSVLYVQVRRPMLLLGTSLGSAAAVDFALAHPEAVAALVLASPQCYTDGIGPMSALPRPIARLGVAVRRSLRAPHNLSASSSGHAGTTALCPCSKKCCFCCRHVCRWRARWRWLATPASVTGLRHM